METIIREFNTKNFTVRVSAEDDNDLDLSFDDTGEIREKLQSGELEAFQVTAKVYFRGSELSADYLGGCVYASPADFQDHRECKAHSRKLSAETGKEITCGSYFSDMIKTAISEARKELANMQSIYIRN